ncbi:hypothetical protein LPJ74_002226 [Coemansia sp. RSA 1843]|nr:hypothetical protein LPJ74_002226 [Coemansia sp. RSA 1843]
MHRSPYSRETTDISDQELRQILDSENISGLPAPYCLVPHFDAHFPPPQNALWQQQQQQQQQQIRHVSPSAAHRYNSAYVQTGPVAGQGSSSSLSSVGGQDGGAAGSTVVTSDSGVAGTSRAQSSTSASAQTGEVTRRRTRTTLTPYQLRVLFRVWERTQYPSSDLRFRLATSLMMTPRNVQIWFQNQRQKTKERAEMRRRTHSPSLNPNAASGASTNTALQSQQRQAMRMHISDSYSRDEHASAMTLPGRSPPESPFRYSHGIPPAPPAIPPAIPHYGHSASVTGSASLPARYALLQHHDPAAASGMGTVLHSRNSSPVPAAYSMLTPPALYSQSFSQQQQHLSASYSHQHYSSQSMPPHQQAQSQAPLNSAHQHVHHQRHASQPHHLYHSQPHISTAATSAVSTKASEATTGSAVYSIQESPLHQSLRPLATPKREARSSEKDATAKRALQLPPPLHTSSHGQAHFSEHNIPSPATPTFVSDKHGAQQPPSPFGSRLRQPSPRLSTPMAALAMARQGLAIDSPPSTEVHEHPANGRARLADILNPIASSDTPPTSASASASASVNARQGQSGPLPSLGSLLAIVKKETDNPLAGDTARNTQHQSFSSSSAVSDSIPANEASPAANEASSESEKWRPW